MFTPNWRMRILLATFIAIVLKASVANAAAPTRILKIPRADDTSLAVDIYDRGEGADDRAMLLIQGSTCKTTQSLAWLDQVMHGVAVRWVAIVEKDGAAADGRCDPIYEAHSTEEARWFDHVAAVHQLKAQLGLRDHGAFDVLAVSAGGLTACALAGATDDVENLALLSTGGGMSFADELSLLTKGDERAADEKRRVQADPRLGRTWMGETNPEIWWWSVLNKRCAPLLRGYSGSTLVIHGSKDESTPIESARTLVDGLKANGRRVDFVEMPTGHTLGLKELPADQNGVGRALRWFRQNGKGH